MNKADRIGADRMAMAIFRLVDRGVIDHRSEAADAALDYARVGCNGGPSSVQQWIESQTRTGRCTPNSTDPACPDCGAVDCERAKSSSRECSSGFEPGQRKVCSRCGRMNCDTL